MNTQFSRRSSSSSVFQTLLQKHIRKLTSAVPTLILITALVFPFIQVTGGNAQNELAYIRQAWVMEADETGLTNPAGITFSARESAFHIADLRQGLPNRTDLVKATPLSARTGLAQVPVALQNPINMVFDNRFNRLLLLTTQGNQILEVDKMTMAT